MYSWDNIWRTLSFEISRCSKTQKYQIFVIRPSSLQRTNGFQSQRIATRIQREMINKCDSKQRSGAEKTPNKKLITVSIKNIINFKNKDYNDSPDVSFMPQETQEEIKVEVSKTADNIKTNTKKDKADLSKKKPNSCYSGLTVSKTVFNVSPKLREKKLFFQNRIIDKKINKLRESVNMSIINFLPTDEDISPKKSIENCSENQNTIQNRNSSLVSILNQDSETLETRTDEINQILQRNYETNEK